MTGFDSTASPFCQHISFKRARLLLLHVCSSCRRNAVADVASTRSIGMRMGGRSDNSRMGCERAGSLAEASDVSIWPINTREKSDAFKGQASSDLTDRTNSYLVRREHFER